MMSIASFVDAVYDCYNKSVIIAEEDQQLPPKDVFEEVFHVLLHVSCMREEGRFPSFRVCFVEPDSAFLNTYIYAHALLFQDPIPFNTRELHRLAPALNPNMSYLMLDTSDHPFSIIGIMASYTTWEKIMTRELTTGNRMPQIPNIHVNGPGDLRICFGEASIVNYRSGHCVFFRTDTFTSTLIASQLAKDSIVPEAERLQLLHRLLWHMNNSDHGAAIMIVPSAESCMDFVDIKYPLSSSYLFGDDNRSVRISGKARDKEIITYVDMIAKLTSVDGGVILTKNFDLVGFGAETLIDKMKNILPSMCFMSHDNTEDKSKHFKDHGMRHRAGYRFCNAVEGSVAFIISQDGSIEACTKYNGNVVVYDNVALPLLNNQMPAL